MCLSGRKVSGMPKFFGTKIQFHSCPLKFLCLRWHSYVHSKTWSCWKKFLTFDSVCESVCVNLREFATRLTNECFVSLSSCPILMSNLTFWFSSSVTFFLACDESSPPTHVIFETPKILKFFSTWRSCLTCQFFSRQKCRIFKSWILDARMTMSRTLQTPKKICHFGRVPIWVPKQLLKNVRNFSRSLERVAHAVLAIGHLRMWVSTSDVHAVNYGHSRSVLGICCC